jgi:hypothetical protein
MPLETLALSILQVFHISNCSRPGEKSLVPTPTAFPSALSQTTDLAAERCIGSQV